MSRTSNVPRWPVPDAAFFSSCYNTEHRKAPATSALLLLETLPWVRPDQSFFEGLPPPAGRFEGKTHVLNAHPPSLPSSVQPRLLITYDPILLVRDARFLPRSLFLAIFLAAAASTAPRVCSRYRPSSRRTSWCGSETVPVAPPYRFHYRGTCSYAHGFEGGRDKVVTRARGIRMVCVNNVLAMKLLKCHVIALGCGVMMRGVGDCGVDFWQDTCRLFRTSHKRKRGPEMAEHALRAQPATYCSIALFD